MSKGENPEAMAAEVASQLLSGAEVLRRTAEAHALLVARVAAVLIDALRGGGKILLCGNGGSAAQAQHLATELLARYKLERKSLPALALGTDPTFVTAWANDYDFGGIFARQVDGLGRPGDVLWAFSTSGNSPNVLRALAAGRAQGLTLVGFTGGSGGQMKDRVEHCLCVPSVDTARIQEAHLAAGHAICDLVERALAA
ncbi:MAG: D-sedoheptulose-7-phosphate isomerase [Chloroflexota bacterium]